MINKIECQEGWRSIIEQCHSTLSVIDPTYQVLQIKEKFGGLRYYFSPTENLDSALVKQMQTIVFIYEDMSMTICETCGQEGKLITRNNWRKVRCLKHQ